MVLTIEEISNAIRCICSVHMRFPWFQWYPIYDQIPWAPTLRLIHVLPRAAIPRNRSVCSMPIWWVSCQITAIARAKTGTPTKKPKRRMGRAMRDPLRTCGTVQRHVLTLIFGDPGISRLRMLWGRSSIFEDQLTARIMYTWIYLYIHILFYFCFCI